MACDVVKGTTRSTIYDTKVFVRIIYIGILMLILAGNQCRQIRIKASLINSSIKIR